jgi:sulfoxide reductase catalytic subunit YedY
MIIRKPSDIPSSEITPYADYQNRRQFISNAVKAGIGVALATELAPQMAFAENRLNYIKGSLTTTGEDLTSFKDATTYNNYYEFGVQKDEPAQYAGTLHTRPWTVTVEGLVKQKKTFDIDALLKLRPLEERVYRHRCVEAWSMVIPWIGYSLSELLKQCDPLPGAKYVQFLSLYDRRQMPLASQSSINWPYSEGLRMDEAMHPLTLLTFGLYGQVLPNQNGAPIRVTVPWKYGFKSAKSIVSIKLLSSQPPTTWNDLAPGEYGFYSNVNPNHDHPRWTQKFERRIGEPFYKQRRTTLMFNGYTDQVASMYKGMDLNRYY